MHAINIGTDEANEMATIRVPYPGDAEERRSVFERAALLLAKHGRYEGTPDSGAFRGTSPIGVLAGHYWSEPGSEVLVIEVTEKPWIVPISLLENEVRRVLAQA